MYTVPVAVIMFTFVYVLFIRPRVRTFKYVAGIMDAVDGKALTGWSRISAMVSGYKTVFFSALAGITPMIPSLLDQLQTFTGWSAFLGQDTANKITATLAIAAALTHAMGIERAAKAEPKR